MRPRKVQSLPE